jgi:hypothetical protein
MMAHDLKRMVMWGMAVAMALGSWVYADWPMAGHDPQRTSWAEEEQMAPATRIVWMRKVEPWIPTKAHVITVRGEGERPDMIFVPTAAGVYALRADTGAQVWVYATAMPVGHSPTYAGGRLYVACTDGRIHCLDAGSGKAIWRTGRAGGPFDVSPLVVEGKERGQDARDTKKRGRDALDTEGQGRDALATKRQGRDALATRGEAFATRVFAGCRDGRFYCFRAADGSLAWSFPTEGPISFSAAYADGVVYFAGYDCHAYALRAETGKLVWKSPKLPGEGFYSFWPVVAGDRVLLAGSNYYHIVGDSLDRKSLKLEKLTRTDAWPEGVQEDDLVGPLDEQGWMDGGQFVKYLTDHPQRQTMHVLDRATGKVAEVAPLCWWGNPSGNRYPPVMGPDGVAYITTPWVYHPAFCKGRVAGWKVGTAKLFPLPHARTGLDSNDEPGAYAIIGSDALYYNHKGDQEASVYGLQGGILAHLPAIKQLEAFLPDYYSGIRDVHYGDPIYEGIAAGTHGNVNPPVPLKSRVYFHRSNALVCLGGEGILPLRGAGASARVRGPEALDTREQGRDALATKERDAGAMSKDSDLPTVRPLRQRLAEEVRKMIDAGHLRPLYAGCTEHYYANTRAKLAENMHIYWHNPAETIYTLLRALPHVPAELREPLRRYIQAEWQYAPPTRYTHMGWGGAQREWADIPPELEPWFKGNAQAKPGNYARGFQGWSFNPFSFYACWKYAKEFGGAREILAAVRPLASPLPAESFLADKPHVVNCYVAGYYGLLGLAELAGEPADETVEQWLKAALARRVALCEQDPRTLTSIEAGGYLFLVPELGEHLYRHARAKVAAQVKRQDEVITPLWFLARVDESTKLPVHTKFNEGATSHFYDVSGTFNAMALALKRPQVELIAYLDSPLVQRGDLFYIQNLVSTIEAGAQDPGENP